MLKAACEKILKEIEEEILKVELLVKQNLNKLVMLNTHKSEMTKFVSEKADQLNLGDCNHVNQGTSSTSGESTQKNA